MQMMGVKKYQLGWFQIPERKAPNGELMIVDKATLGRHVTIL